MWRDSAAPVRFNQRMGSTLPEAACRFSLVRPNQPAAALVIASPHSGQDYTPEFLHITRLDLSTLRRSEDSFVEELFAAAPKLGLPMLAAEFPRTWCDPNREAWELDPAMFNDTLPAWVNTNSPRVKAGLGTIARIVASGEAIYGDKLRFADAEDRVRQCWQPYHDALAGLLAETRAQFGACLLLDCHSMPSAGAGRDLPDFILGDGHGTTCGPAIIQYVEQFLADQGYRVRRNAPYAGGYVTRHYGRPRENAHALQIEIARPLYMDEQTYRKLPRFRLLRRDLTGLMTSLAKALPELLPACRT